MPKLTFAEIFGDNAYFLASDDNGNKSIVIDLEAFGTDDYLGLGNVGIFELMLVNGSNLDNWASKLFYGLLMRYLQRQPTTNTDPTLPVHITNLGKKNVVRGGTAQVVYSVTINAYITDPLQNVMNLNSLVG